MIPTKFRCIWRSGFREDFQKSTSQKQGLPVVAMLANESRRNEKYLYRGSSMEAFYQISVHLTKWFQRTFFRNQPIRNNNQGLIHLAKQFQRRFFFQKSTNQNQEWPVAARFVNGSGRNEQFLQRTFHRCFLPSFCLFAEVVSEKINQSETRIAFGGFVC